MYDLLRKESKGDGDESEKMPKQKKNFLDLIKKLIKLSIKKLLKLTKQFDMKKADMMPKKEARFLKI